MEAPRRGSSLHLRTLASPCPERPESAHPESDVPTERRQVWQGTVASSHPIGTPLADQVYGQQPCSTPSVSIDRRRLAIDCR